MTSPNTPIVLTGTERVEVAVLPAAGAAFGAPGSVATTQDIANLAIGRVTGPTTPASAAAAGVAGTILWDASYIYVCVATDTWKRVAIATWP